MYLGPYEWTITRDAGFYHFVYNIPSSGRVLSNIPAGSHIVRPVFNLLPPVSYVSGDGTSENPIRVN